ncbi:MAG: site-specific DNA-methyltransferase [Gaiellales bacterium]
MLELPAASVDMILCDLPYGTTRNGWDSVIDLEALWTQYLRVAKPNAAIVLFSQGLFTARLIMSRPELFRYKLVWEKSKPTNFLNAPRQPLRKHEDICIFYRSQPTYVPQMSQGAPYDKGVRKSQQTGSYGNFAPVRVRDETGQRFPTDIVYCKTAESEGAVWHPTQKPVELARYLVRTYTAPGDVVLDNACGVGSFPLAAALEGRRFIGIEMNAQSRQFKEEPVDYVQIARERIAAATAATAAAAVE